MEGYLLKTFSSERIILETNSQTIFLLLIVFGVIFLLIFIFLITNLITSYPQTRVLFGSLSLIALCGGLLGYLNPEPKQLILNSKDQAIIVDQRAISGVDDGIIPFHDIELIRVYRGLDPDQMFHKDYIITYEMAFEMNDGNSIIIARSPTRDELENYAKKLTIVLDVDLYFDRTRFYRGFGSYYETQSNIIEIKEGGFLEDYVLKSGVLYKWKEYRSIWLIVLMSLIYLGMMVMIVFSIIPSIPKNSLRKFKLMILIILCVLLSSGFAAGFYYLTYTRNNLLVSEDSWSYSQSIGRWKFNEVLYRENPITMTINDITEDTHRFYLLNSDGYWNYIALLLTLKESPSLKTEQNHSNLMSYHDNLIRVSDFSLSLYEKYALSKALLETE